MRGSRRRYSKLLLVGLFIAAIGLAAGAGEYRIEIRETSWELEPGLSTAAYTYGGSVPGVPIVARPGERLKVEFVNRLPVATNVHWHGLVVPADQDGPALRIEPGASHTYEFTVGESGTYWYHPHVMPVLPQLDRGLYAPLIALSPEDAKYSGDHVYVLDDWYLDARGRRLEGTAPGDMERHGNVETVNGKTGGAVEPLRLRAGELHKLRFINASTASAHTLHAAGHAFRVTHADGHALARPYVASRLVLAPGERIDAELFASGEEGGRYEIASSRPGLGLAIPIVYGVGRVPAVASPFAPPPHRAFGLPRTLKPDIELVLASAMGSGGMGMMHGGGMAHGGGMGGSSMRWTINGRSFPETAPIEVKVGEVVTMRIRDRDMMSMMMGHRMEHPVHIHGTYFRLLSVDGTPPEGETWKDTIPVPPGGYVDIAFVMANPGDWLLHCHIIDHEDGGMMTVIRAR